MSDSENLQRKERVKEEGKSDAVRDIENERQRRNDQRGAREYKKVEDDGKQGSNNEGEEDEIKKNGKETRVERWEKMRSLSGTVEREELLKKEKYRVNREQWSMRI